MPTSGIGLAKEARVGYDRVFKKSSKPEVKLPYMIFKFNDKKTEIIIDEDDKYYEKELDYDELLGTLPQDSPRYVAYDFEYLNSDKTCTSAVIVLLWAPPLCGTKDKFIGGTTFSSFVHSIDAKIKFEGGEVSDLNEAEICSSKHWHPVPSELKRQRQGKLHVKLDNTE